MEKCAQSIFQLPSKPVSHLEIGPYFHEPFVFISSAFAGQVLLGKLGRFFFFLGSLDDSQL